MAVSGTAGEPAAQRLQNPYTSVPDWFYPASVVFFLGLFALYGLWVTFFNFKAAAYGPYLSPFNSPLVEGRVLPPALWIAWVPLGFRLTCYYYRKAIFRGFWFHPRSCARNEPRRGAYFGETRFFLFNNLHRFMLYLAVAQIVILWYDLFVAFYYRGQPHLGVGNALMLVNVVCLSGYTFGCHALRHLAGGGTDCLSCVRTRYQLWKGVTVLNVNHAVWAWVSMFTVWGTDIYIRLLANGVIPHQGWV